MNLRCPVNFEELQPMKITFIKRNSKKTSFINKPFLLRNQSLWRNHLFRIQLNYIENQSPCKILGFPYVYQSRNDKKMPIRIKCLLIEYISSSSIKFRNYPKISPQGSRIFPVQKFPLFIQENLYHNLLSECEFSQKKLNKLKNDISLFKKNVTLKEERIHSILQTQLLKKIIPTLDEIERAKNFSIDKIKSKKTRKFIKIFSKNLQMVYNSFIKETGLTVIRPSGGELFNDRFHTIIGIVYNENEKNNSILEVIKNGYIFNGEVLDSAQIIVSTTNPNHPNIISQ